VTSRNAVRTNRPTKGLVAFARAAAMGSLGTGGAALHATYPAIQPFAFVAQLDRSEDRMHPGEGSA
jgi:hypothetical protein